mgnify:CR=1 FL=1
MNLLHPINQYLQNTPEDKDTDAGRSNETNVKQTSAEIPEEQNNDKGGEK